MHVSRYVYRAGVPPFKQAREVLESLSDFKEDILKLCHDLPSEVINLSKYVKQI